MTPIQLKTARRKLGLTQAELGFMVGTNARGVRYWEAETNPLPMPFATERLIKAYMAGYRPTDWPV